MKIPVISSLFGKNTVKPQLASINRNASAETKSDTGYAALTGFLSEDGTPYWFTNIPTHDIVRYFQQIPPLHTAVMRIANAVADLPIHLVDQDTQKPQPDHPAMQLLNAPNGQLQKTRFDYIRDLIIWYILAGNAYPMLAGRPSQEPVEMHLLNPLYTSMISSNGYISANVIQYTPANGVPYSFEYNAAKQRYYSPTNAYQELYHINNFNATHSGNELEGRSEAESLYYEVNHYIHGSQHNLALLRNGARPAGAFTLKTQTGLPANLSPEQFQRLQSQINLDYTGAANAGRPLLLEGGLEFQEMQMSPKDLDYKSLAEAAEQQIYKVLGIPIQLVTSDKATAGNMDNIRLEFYENRVLPLGKGVICNHLNNFLLKRYGASAKRLQFTINKDEIDVLSDQRIQKRKAIENSTTLTINEKRAMYFLPPIKHGDKIVDPNGRPIAGEDAESMVGDLPQNEAAKPTQAAPPIAK